MLPKSPNLPKKKSLKPSTKEKDSDTKGKDSANDKSVEIEKETLKVTPIEKRDKAVKSRNNSTVSSKSQSIEKKQPVKKDSKLEVQGKKMKIPKLKPAPLTDKEKFDLLFEAYSKWGVDENCPELGISAYQLTRWLKNVEMLDGKKVSLQ